MSVVCVLDAITAWVQENICTEIQLKVPAEDREPTDAGYDYQLATPAAFPLYVPAKDKLPPNVRSPFPSVCVRFIEGDEKLTENSGTMGVQLCFSVWNPGEHGEDIFRPVDGQPNARKRWTGPEAVAHFKRNGEGWRDAWNFVDIALRKLGNAIAVGDCELDRSTPIKYGPLTEQGEIVEAFPCWFAWVSFTVNYSLRRNVAEIENLL